MREGRLGSSLAVFILMAMLGTPGLAQARSPAIVSFPVLLVELTFEELAALTAATCRGVDAEPGDAPEPTGDMQPQGITAACLRAWLASQPDVEDRIRVVVTPASPLPFTRPEPGSYDDSRIQTWCARAWPTDAPRRAACVEEQRAALRTLFRPLTGAPAAVTQRIRSQCAADWSEDYVQRAACEQQQAEAYRPRPR